MKENNNYDNETKNDSKDFVNNEYESLNNLDVNNYKSLEENVDNSFDLNEENETVKDVEKNYYSKYMYKRFLRFKRKGLDYGITVPDLHYPLEKPTSPRIAFKITTFVMFALAVVVFALSVYFLVKCKVFTMLYELINNTKSVFTEKAFEESLGLSSIASVGAVWVYMLCGVLILVPILAIIGLLLIARKNWVLSKVSRQEMAKGYEVSKYIFIAFVLLFLTTTFIIVILATNGFNTTFSKVAFTILLVIFAYLIINIIVIKIEKQKDEIWFNELPLKMQQDFINQNKVMKRVLNSRIW